MAEIKSALELAMEKSRKITISEKEREELKQKEVMRKAMSLFHRFEDGYLSLNEVLKEIDRMEEKTKAEVRQALLSKWTDAITLDHDYGRILRGIESLRHRNLDDVKQKMDQLVAQYREEKEGTMRRMSIRAAEALREEGIHGSAVDPNPDGDREYQALLDDIHRSFGSKTEEVREALRRSL